MRIRFMVKRTCIYPNVCTSHHHVDRSHAFHICAQEHDLNPTASPGDKTRVAAATMPVPATPVVPSPLVRLVWNHIHAFKVNGEV